MRYTENDMANISFFRRYSAKYFEGDNASGLPLVGFIC